MAVDRKAAERAVADFLRALGHAQESNPELGSTPGRVVEAWASELLAGYEVDVAALIGEGGAGSSDASGSIVVVRGIAVTSMCPHHLLPSFGHGLVAYRPGDRVLGLGTIARLVDAYARRLALQEEIGQNVVKALLEHAGARGAYCELSLRHTCLSARGAAKSQAIVSTHVAGGDLAGPAAASELLLALREEPER